MATSITLLSNVSSPTTGTGVQVGINTLEGFVISASSTTNVSFQLIIQASVDNTFAAPIEIYNKTVYANSRFADSISYVVPNSYYVRAVVTTISNTFVTVIANVSSSISYVSYVSASRTLTQDDDGLTLDCASGITLTIPPGLYNFGCAVRPSGTLISCGAGVTTNGASTTLTTIQRIAAINPTATSNSYDVVGV